MGPSRLGTGRGGRTHKSNCQGQAADNLMCPIGNYLYDTRSCIVHLSSVLSYISITFLRIKSNIYQSELPRLSRLYQNGMKAISKHMF